MNKKLSRTNRLEDFQQELFSVYRKLGILHKRIEIIVSTKRVLVCRHQEIFVSLFNTKEVNLLGIYNAFSLGYDGIIFQMCHKEFEIVEQGIVGPIFQYEDAIKRYPFLVSESNPILYRRFKCPL